MAPRVLVSDKLSETAVQIFRDRGVEVDYLPDLGKDKDALLAAISSYDGLAIRSATKVTPKIIAAATKLKVIGRAGKAGHQAEAEQRLCDELHDLLLPCRQSKLNVCKTRNHP